MGTEIEHCASAIIIMQGKPLGQKSNTVFLLSLLYLISVFLHTVLYFIKKMILCYFKTPLFRNFSVSFGTSK